MILVDPFVPVRKPPPSRQRPASIPKPRQPVRPQTMLRPRRPVTRPAPAVASRKPFGRPKLQKQSSPRRSRLIRFLRALPIILVLLVLAGATGALLIGEAAISLYAISALLLRISSRTSFALALTLLLATIVLQIVLPGTGFAENCAVYAFLFVVTGTISLAIETRSLDAATYSIRRKSE